MLNGDRRSVLWWQTRHISYAVIATWSSIERTLKRHSTGYQTFAKEVEYKKIAEYIATRLCYLLDHQGSILTWFYIKNKHMKINMVHKE